MKATDINWAEAQRISDLPAVDAAIRDFAKENTGDNATMLVREVMAACLSAPEFEQAWAKMEAKGFQYGREALNNVRLGWEMRGDTIAGSE